MLLDRLLGARRQDLLRGLLADIFDDANIARDLTLPYEQRNVAMQQIMRPEAVAVWDEFRKLADGARY